MVHWLSTALSKRPFNDGSLSRELYRRTTNAMARQYVVGLDIAHRITVKRGYLIGYIQFKELDINDTDVEELRFEVKSPCISINQRIIALQNVPIDSIAVERKLHTPLDATLVPAHTYTQSHSFISQCKKKRVQNKFNCKRKIRRRSTNCILQICVQSALL